MNRRFITTGVSRVLWGQLHKPSADSNSARKYKAVLLIPKGDMGTIDLINAAIADAAVEGLEKTWHGANIERIMLPMWDGDKPRKPGYEPEPRSAGCMAIFASSYSKPDIFDILMQPIDDPKEVYNGMYVCATLRFAPYMYEGTPGVRCVIGPIMKIMDGAPIPQQPPMEQALSHAAKKLHRQMIGGMVASLSPDRLGDDMPYNDRGDIEAPPSMQLHHLFDLKNTPEPSRAIAQPKAPAGQSEEESLPKKASGAPGPAPMDDLEGRLEKLKDQSMTLEEFKIFMQEPA